MRKEKSWARQNYELVYRYMRRGYDWEFIAFNANGGRKAMQAANYSYQARNYDAHGWSNDTRRKRFNAIKWRISSKAQIWMFDTELPF